MLYAQTTYGRWLGLELLWLPVKWEMKAETNNGSTLNQNPKRLCITVMFWRKHYAIKSF